MLVSVDICTQASETVSFLLRANLLAYMKRGFLLHDTKLPPRQSLPTCRLATQPPARMLATERNPKGQPITEKLPAELLATEHPGVVAYDVLCLVASQLAFFTGAISVLELCRGQNRCLYIRIRDAQTFIARLQNAIARLPLPSPISMILATHCEPTRFLVARMFFYDLGGPLLTLFFNIWRAVRYTPNK